MIDEPVETFLLFSRSFPSQNLGFVDAKATDIDIEIGPKTFSIVQSPGILRSNRETGTTGAVLWKITPSIASWLACPSNPLRRCHLLNSATTIVELGCGISGLIGLILAPGIKKYVLTDQAYVSKVLQGNLLANRSTSRTSQNLRYGPSSASLDNLIFHSLDWEKDTVHGLSEVLGPKAQQVNFLIACDCIYNEHLIQPFVETCADVCLLGSTVGSDRDIPTVLLVAQQLRSEEIFQSWLDASLKKFDIWRVPNHLLSESLKDGSGYAIHVGVLKGQIKET